MIEGSEKKNSPLQPGSVVKVWDWIIAGTRSRPGCGLCPTHNTNLKLFSVCIHTDSHRFQQDYFEDAGLPTSTRMKNVR